LGAGAGAYGAEDAPPAGTPDAGLVILEFKPSFDDLMTMLIQPRHIKLFYAGEEENWLLARFQLNELRFSFGRIAATIPDYGIFPVTDAFESTVAAPMDEVLAAIDAEDKPAFDRAYVNLTAACNACHDATHFPFIVMTVPDPAAARLFVDQDFRPVGGQ
jgi:hypothetical protein